MSKYVNTRLSFGLPFCAGWESTDKSDDDKADSEAPSDLSRLKRRRGIIFKDLEVV